MIPGVPRGVMDRRSFISTVACGVLAAPTIARAQTRATVRRIGLLSSGSRPNQAELQAIYAPLRQLGWIEGQNVVFERRYTDGKDELLRPYADELVRLKVDMIVTSGTVATLAAKSATKTIPIVMRSAGDPVLSGIVTSLAKPGGNITGYARVAPELSLKRLALVRELFPTAQRVAWLENSNNPYYRAARKQIESASQSLAIQSLFIGVAKADELDQAVADATSQHAQAMIVQDDALFNDNPTRLFAAALKHALPTIVGGKSMLEAGGFVSYGDTDAEGDARYAAFIDRILRGANPADLPIEQPTKFELVINLKTARALAITIPQSVLLHADAVIE
jgi:putative ABC transport system substrate-binding protein